MLNLGEKKKKKKKKQTSEVVVSSFFSRQTFQRFTAGYGRLRVNVLQEDAFAEATAGGEEEEEEEIIPELGLDKKKKKKKKREVRLSRFSYADCVCSPQNMVVNSQLLVTITPAACDTVLRSSELLQARADSEFTAEAGADLADGEEDGQENKPTGPAWEGSDRDYSYEELLGGFFSHLIDLSNCTTLQYTFGISLTLRGNRLCSVCIDCLGCCDFITALSCAKASRFSTLR